MEGAKALMTKIDDERERRLGLPEGKTRNEVCVLVTLGKQGVVAVVRAGSSGKSGQDKEEFQSLHIPAPTAEKVVDTSGAGDSFLGTFSAGCATCLRKVSKEDFLADVQSLGPLLRGIIEDSCRVATISVGRKGCQSSYPRRDELDWKLFQSLD